MINEYRLKLARWICPDTHHLKAKGHRKPKPIMDCPYPLSTDKPDGYAIQVRSGITKQEMERGEYGD
jgi:hypothetical protein